MNYNEMRMAIMGMVIVDPKIGLAIRKSLIERIDSSQRNTELENFLDSLLQLERTIIEAQPTNKIAESRVKCLQNFEILAMKHGAI